MISQERNITFERYAYFNTSFSVQKAVDLVVRNNKHGSEKLLKETAKSNSQRNTSKLTIFQKFDFYSSIICYISEDKLSITSECIRIHIMGEAMLLRNFTLSLLIVVEVHSIFNHNMSVVFLRKKVLLTCMIQFIL